MHYHTHAQTHTYHTPTPTHHTPHTTETHVHKQITHTHLDSLVVRGRGQQAVLVDDLLAEVSVDLREISQIVVIQWHLLWS